MITIKKFNERSFSEVDIPNNFYIVSEYDRNITLESLKKHSLEELKGISDSGLIILDFMGVARNIILKMPGDKVVKENKLSRIMYDNPHYLVSNNLEALARIWQKSRDSFGFGVFQNLFDYMKVYIKRTNPGSNSALSALLQEWEYSSVPDFDFSKYFKSKSFKISNVKDFAIALDKAGKDLEDYTGKEFFDELTVSEKEELLIGTLNIIGEIFSDERENGLLKQTN